MKKIIISMGDPRGIGPEIIIRSLAELSRDFDYTIAGSAPLLLAEAEKQNFHLQKSKVIDPGPSEGPGETALSYIDLAVSLVSEHPGSALVTAPVEKAVIAEKHPGFTGHTGYISALCSSRPAVMTFITQRMKMSLLTEHIPLKDVPGAISIGKIVSHIVLLREELRKWFGICNPRFVVASVNPHAGEAGLIGGEETAVIKPALDILRKDGINADGPFGAAYALRAALSGNYDFIVSPYHDQILPAFKNFLGPSVNMTMGLGFVRTSPDHGPAVDTAGKVKADHSSMKAAIELAVSLAHG